MKIKTIALLGFCSVALLGTSSWAKSEKTPETQVSSGFKAKVLEWYNLMSKNESRHRFGGKINQKQLVYIYSKYFNETELAEVVETFKKLLQYDDKINKSERELYETMYAQIQKENKEKLKKQTPAPKEKKKKQTEQVEQLIDNNNSAEYKNKTCQIELSRQLEEIQKGINRVKNAFATGAYPQKLDDAEEGKQSYENELFTYILNFNDSENWSKKGNTYSYNCGKTNKSFTYNPKDGSFK